MKKIEAVFRPERLDQVARSLDEAGFQGFTITDARGHGRSPDKVGEWRGVAYEMLVRNGTLRGRPPHRPWRLSARHEG